MPYPNALLRQANCYASSSDAAFADRYDAMQRYGAVRTGAVDVEGGWRVYSSGRARSADSRLTRTARVGW